MTPADIERMAREAGIDMHADTLCRYEGWAEPMMRFAALVQAAERERCAILCETTASQHYASARIAAEHLPVQFRAAAEALTNAASAIRADLPPQRTK